MIRYKTKNFNCPLELAFDIIGGRWKPRIIWCLGTKTMRSGELERIICDTSRKVLIEQLRELEQDGIVKRVVYAEVPPKVEYSLAERGLLLLPILAPLYTWGMEQASTIQAQQENTTTQPEDTVQVL